MTFLVRTEADLGLTADGRLVKHDDPDALGQVPAGRLISIDDAERLGLTSEAEERKRANRGQPLDHDFKGGKE